MRGTASSYDVERQGVLSGLMRCKKHNSPMYGMADPFGNETILVCRACRYERSADAMEKKAEAMLDRGDESAYEDLRRRAEK